MNKVAIEFFENLAREYQLGLQILKMALEARNDTGSQETWN
jgi:hypothetical protein